MTDNPRIETFETQGPARLRLEIPRGRIRLVGEGSAETRIELFAPHGDLAALDWIAGAEVAEVGGEIVVRNPGFRRFGLLGLGIGGQVEAAVHAPAGSAATMWIGAGGIETSGPLGALAATTGAGSIRVARCETAKLRAGSGHIDVAEASGRVDAKTGAGRVGIGKAAEARIATGAGSARIEEVAGAAHLTTGHGDIEVGRAGASVEAFTASGNVEVGRAERGRVRAKSVSGRVSVGVPEGVAALLDIHTASGRVRSDLAASAPPAEGEPQVELVLSTVSGNVSVVRA